MPRQTAVTPLSAGMTDHERFIRTTRNVALLCIDLQEMPPTTSREDVDFSTADVAAFEAGKGTLLQNVKSAQCHARDNGMEVVHCKITSMTKDGRDRSRLHKRMGIHVPPPSAGAQGSSAAGSWMSGVGPRDDEIVFLKTGSNAFVCTNIDYVLKNMGIDRLVCCGVLTDECVAGTVKAACDLGYECTVLEDACLAGSLERHRGSIMTLARFASVCSTAAWVAFATSKL